MYVFANIYGGLGNQLFQFLWLSQFLLSHQRDLHQAYLIYRNRHATKRSLSPLWPRYYLSDNLVIRFLVSLRLPMILERLRISKSGYIRIYNLILVDSYFQRIEQFQHVDIEQINYGIDYLRNYLDVPGTDRKTVSLYHLRLTDIAQQYDFSEGYITDALSKMTIGSHIITDDEGWFDRDNCKKILESRNLTLLRTQSFTSEDVLRTMMLYPEIISTGSTLAFWAAILGNSNLRFLRSTHTKHAYELDSLLNFYFHLKK